MKILILNDQAGPTGGAELLTRALRDGLAARGHDARIFSSRAGSTPESSFADYTCFGTTGALRTLNRALNVSAPRRLRQVLEEFRPEVVHVRMFLTQLSPLVLPLLSAVPTVYHASWYSTVCPTGLRLLPDRTICTERSGVACLRTGCLSPPAWGALMLQKHLLERWRHVFDRVVANSHAVRDVLVGYGIAPVEVIWNGVAERPARPPLSGPPTLSYAGRLSWEKGVDLLIQAFAPVAERLPEVRLVIAGDGPDRTDLEDLAAALGLGERVSFLGHVPPEEVGPRLDPAWAHVVPSRLAEPFGLATAEAMMRGTAVVASDTGGLPELVEHGVSGLLVRTGDAAALSEGLFRVLSDRALAEGMGAAGRARARADFTLDRAVNRFEALYSDLVSRERTPR